MRSYIIKIVFLVSFLSPALCKIYNNCELAQELHNNFGVQRPELGTWVCIAKYESEYNTEARNDDTGDHGIFQISQIYWCSPPGQGCGVTCDSLRDDDITDDFICARKVYDETQLQTGNGFTAWTTYSNCNNNEETDKLIEDCNI